MLNKFNSIYQAAQKRDDAAFKAATDYGCIDEHKQGRDYWSAAAQLASEKEIAAAEWLLARGANINFVAYAAACAGLLEYAEKLLIRGANINFVAMGAAFSGNREYVEKLLSRGADINDVARSVAHGGDGEYAEQLLEQGADINHVAYGVANGGDKKYAEELLKRGADINFVAGGATFSGDLEYAEKLLIRGADLESIIMAAARGGHRKYAQDLIKRNWGLKQYDLVGMSAAEGGHKEYAQHFLILHNADIDRVVQGAARGGHRKYARELLEGNARESDSCIDRVALGAAEGGQITSNNAQSQLDYLPYFNNNVLPKLIAACKLFTINILPKVEQRVLAMSKYMHNHRLTHGQALVKTDPDCKGLLNLLMLLHESTVNLITGDLSNIPEIIIYSFIFQYLAPTLSYDNFKQLGELESKEFKEFKESNESKSDSNKQTFRCVIS